MSTYSVSVIRRSNKKLVNIERRSFRSLRSAEVYFDKRITELGEDEYANLIKDNVPFPKTSLMAQTILLNRLHNFDNDIRKLRRWVAQTPGQSIKKVSGVYVHYRYAPKN